MTILTTAADVSAHSPADPPRVDSDNIHLNPTPQPSPHPIPGQTTHLHLQAQPTDDFLPHPHASRQHRRAHSQPLVNSAPPLRHTQTLLDAEESGTEQSMAPPPQPAKTQQRTRRQQAAEAELDCASDQMEEECRPRECDVSESSTPDSGSIVNSALTRTTPRVSSQHTETSVNFQQTSQTQPGMAAANVTSTAPSPAVFASSPLPSPLLAASSTISSSSATVSQPLLRPPPPIVLAQSSWREHLDSTPVPAWLQHYRIEGAAYNALSHLSFRQLYSFTEDDCRRMLGRRKGEALFASTRDYARRVQSTYATRNKPVKQQTAVHTAVAVSEAAAPSPTQSRQVQHVTTNEVSGASPSGGAVGRERRRSGRRRHKSAVHTAIVISPPDLPSAQLVFIPPNTTSATETASPQPDTPTSQPNESAESPHTHHTTVHEPLDAAAVTSVATTAGFSAAPAAAAGPSLPALSPAAAVSSVVRSHSLSPIPPPLPQSSSFGALTDQLLDRSNAWLTRSVLAIFKDQQQQQHYSQQQPQQHAAHSTAASSVGVNSLLSGRTHARLTSILSGAGALHELEPQPF